MASTPAYRRIAQDLLTAIEDGTLLPDQRLPSESELAERYGVARMTVRQAVDPLVQDGLLVRRQGAGTFVARAAPTRRMDRLKSFTEEIESAGGQLTTRLVACEVVPASTEVAVLLALEASAEVVRVARLRIIDGVPTTVMTSWLPQARVAGLEHMGLADGSLYAALRKHFDLVPRRAVQRVSAVAADRTRASLLGVETGAPTLYIERVTYDERERPFEFARSWSRPGFELSVDVES